MNRDDKFSPKNDPAAQEALREEGNKPDPLYNKTDRNFQRQNQGPQNGTTHDAVMENEQEAERSSSNEEKDII